MELDKTDEVVSRVREWSIEKVEEVESIGDKDAIYKEFEEWIEIEDEESLEIVSLCEKESPGSVTVKPSDIE